MSAAQTLTESDVIDQFCAAMREQDISVSPADIEPDGKLHRIHVDGDPKNVKNGWYCLHIDERPAGEFGCNRRYGHDHKFKWSAKQKARRFTAEERKAYRDRMERKRAEREAELAARHAAAAALARQLWDAASDCETHPYLERKQIQSHGLRVGKWEKIDEETGDVRLISKQALLVPIRDTKKQIHSLQAIFPRKLMGGRDKDYLTGGNKAEHFYSIGKPVEFEGRIVIIICEGYATGASLHEATGHAVIVAFDAPNLLPVAQAIRARFPDAIIIIAADNDQWTLTPVNNPGVTRAREAALAIGGLVAVPPFQHEEGKQDEDGKWSGPNDFNDLKAREGADAVKSIIDDTLDEATRVLPLWLVPKADPADLDRIQFSVDGLATFDPSLTGRISRRGAVLVEYSGAGDLHAAIEKASRFMPSAVVQVLADPKQERETVQIAQEAGVSVRMPQTGVSWADALWEDFCGMTGSQALMGMAAQVEAAPRGEADVPPLRTIQVIAGELPRVVDDAEQALIEQCSDIFQRAGSIVRPALVKIDVADGRQIEGIRLVDVNKHHLAERLTAAARWEKFDGRSEEFVPIDAPLKFAETYLAREGMWKLRKLAGVVNAPTLRPDGSILDRPGFDETTGLLLEAGSFAFDPIPDRPTKDDAAKALARLDSLFDTFPFVTATDRSVALSAVLTACIRRSLPTAPMHAFSAPAAGSGKSMLVDIAAIIACGRQAAVLSQGRDESEAEKRIGAALLAGDQVLSLDNCTLPLDGDLLCQVHTQPTVRLRPLGGSKLQDAPTNVAMFATGNSLIVQGDMTRRVLLGSLDPQCERPELREFSCNPMGVALAGRAGYLRDALTVLRAFHVAGRPRQASPLGSFEAWSDWVRGALLWLGKPDPVVSMERARQGDPKREALRAVMHQWHDAIGGERTTAADLIKRATETEVVIGYGKPAFLREGLREALLTVAGQGGTINSRTLGKWLAAHQDRIVDGMRFQQVGTRSGVALWQIFETGGMF
ncbi:toprim domain-containing protein [Ralstonia pseudosolanacearum]|uniref:toprim domain-containing protein n=1 Tax=Ralstonia pseudosolanacearum TaxID=1310165 RepID=UPI0006761702|nr:toprim domain-containing protein [Ralstonia pseudosolanacearum]MDO3558278.1 toprim domain-containing protein [Ralstonia pseudosolanacearum]MDO3575529.1 toprim domain-containing protein [Ralstonia pseudosolanacearum]MDO3586901.1 toprim domain-containing protein [Ralstonia pseudosolanacearum]